jgi:competence ComEA-like helix-hairpin-helix protein
VRRTADTLVDLNTATRAQLEGHCWLTKPTLGKLLQAQRRKLGLRGWDDVRRISGIRPRELAWLQANCVIRPRIPTALDLNTATEAELQRLPGVGPALARRIVAHRDSVGGFCSLAHLDDVRGIGPATLAKWQGLAIVVPRADTTHTRSEGP